VSQPAGPGPFATLGLPARAGLTDDEVRAAWRRVAAATHPDRADGGDQARFAAAAAAYTTLRTPSGRAEALADLTGGPDLAVVPGPTGVPGPADSDGPAISDGPATTGGGPPASHARPWGQALIGLARLLARAGRGRPAVLLVRLVAAAAVVAAAVVAAGWTPASAAVLTGAVTWLVLTARHDLAPPP
jgi:DnaJ-like protein